MEDLSYRQGSFTFISVIFFNPAISFYFNYSGF